MVSESVSWEQCGAAHPGDPEKGGSGKAYGRRLLYYARDGARRSSGFFSMSRLLCKELRQSLFAGVQCTDVIGVAEGRMEAFRLAGQVIWDVYQETGGFDLRSRFRSEDFVED